MKSWLGVEQVLSDNVFALEKRKIGDRLKMTVQLIELVAMENVLCIS
ncbi:MAG: hypothetical protein AAFR77_12365 [Cyanobacteria bacterium J06631_2]